MRIALVVLVFACGGSSSRPATSRASSASSAGDASGCRPAYAEYERRWRIARSHELAAFPDAFTPTEIEEIVSEETGVLPDRDELQTLRWIYALVEFFTSDTEWVTAFDAAERAIAVCGESALRPG